MIFDRITLVAQSLMREALEAFNPNESKILVDGTMGNGLDTLFLAEQAGPYGHVHAYDIQEEALIITRNLLEEKGMDKRVSCHLKSHHLLTEDVAEIHGAIFNLGYLPGGDLSITTKMDTTMVAIQSVLDLLVASGVAVVVNYLGHEEGRREESVLVPLFRDLPSKKYDVVRISVENRQIAPPVIYMIRKKR